MVYKFNFALVKQSSVYFSVL